MIIGKSMCGRSVVENTDFGAIDHSLYFCLIVDYAAPMVFDHHSTTRSSAVAITETAQPLLPPIHDLYVLMSGNTLVKRRAKLLHNI